MSKQNIVRIGDYLTGAKEISSSSSSMLYRCSRCKSSYQESEGWTFEEEFVCEGCLSKAATEIEHELEGLPEETGADLSLSNSFAMVPTYSPSTALTKRKSIALEVAKGAGVNSIIVSGTIALAFTGHILLAIIGGLLLFWRLDR